MKDMPRHIAGIAAIIIAAFIIVMLFYRAIPDDNREVAMVMLGVALGWATNVFSFYFGSSDGSKSKDDQIERMK